MYDNNKGLDALQFNVYVTSECTRRCPDCYYPKNGEMSLDMAERIAGWILDLCRVDKVKSFKMHVLGGEPFINLPAAYILMSAFKDLPGHPDGKYVLFTNGDLLTKDNLCDLKKFGAFLTLNPTDNSLTEVENRMKLIKEHMGGCSLAVVADAINLLRLPQLANLAIKYKAHMRVNRLYHGGIIPGYVEEFGSQMHKVFDILLTADWIMWPNFILESTYPLWEGPKNCHACGRWLVVVNPDGTIRSCNGDMDTQIGHITTHHKMSDFHFTHRWSSKNLLECQGCEWANGGFCQGGCPFTRKLTYGTYDKKTPFCKVYKTLFPRLMELTERWKVENGMATNKTDNNH